MSTSMAAAPLPDGVYVGAPGGVQVEATRPSGEVRTVGLGAAFTPGTPRLYSVDNANAKYQFAGTAPEPLEKIGAYLHLGGETLAAESVGQSNGTPLFFFTLDAATATSVSSLFGIPKADRTPLDQGITGVFTIGDAHVGQPVPLTLTLTKQSGPTVGLVTGGRDRGPRDNRFSCSAVHEGVALPVKDAPDLGGMYDTPPFAAGDQRELHADLTSWVDFASPGAYSVTCRWIGELDRLDATGAPPGPERNQDRWDLTVEQTLDVRVRK
jgi:hypothetical protein